MLLTVPSKLLCVCSYHTMSFSDSGKKHAYRRHTFASFTHGIYTVS